MESEVSLSDNETSDSEYVRISIELITSFCEYDNRYRIHKSSSFFPVSRCPTWASGLWGDYKNLLFLTGIFMTVKTINFD